MTKIITGYVTTVDPDSVLKLVFDRYGKPLDGHSISITRGDGTPFWTDGSIVIVGLSTPKCSGSKIHAIATITAPESYGVKSFL